MPTCPAITAPSPTVLEPEIPVSATRITFSPMSQFAPCAPVIDLRSPPNACFSQRPAINVEFAPISTSSSITSVPCCGNCVYAPVFHRARSQIHPRPVPPRVHHHAISQRRPRIQHRPRINPAMLANPHALPIEAPASMRVPHRSARHRQPPHMVRSSRPHQVQHQRQLLPKHELHPQVAQP